MVLGQTVITPKGLGVIVYRLTAADEWLVRFRKEDCGAWQPEWDGDNGEKYIIHDEIFMTRELVGVANG